MKTKLCLAVMVAALTMIVGPIAPASAACPAGTTDPNYCTPSAPAVTTNAATAVTSTGATLNGAVVPNGQATTFKFEYGTTTSYGTSTTAAGAGMDYTSHPVSTQITGLQPSTLYHFRISATNASGTVTGGDMTFTTAAATPGPPPAVVTGAAAALTQTSATITGTVNPNGASTFYTFQYGPTTAYGTTTPVGNAGSDSTVHPVAATIAGLTQGTTYHYRLVAASAFGTGVGQDRTFSTTSYIVPPPPPSGRKLPGLSLSVKPKRDRRKPYRYTARGKLKRPKGIGRAGGCKGTVTIRIKRGSKTVAKGKAKIKRSTCRYAKRLTVKRKAKLARRGKLKVSARFGGNAKLKPRSAKRKTVFYGPKR